MKQFRIISAVLSIVFIFLVLAGCGKNNTESEEPTTGQTSEQSVSDVSTSYADTSTPSVVLSTVSAVSSTTLLTDSFGEKTTETDKVPFFSGVGVQNKTSTQTVPATDVSAVVTEGAAGTAVSNSFFDDAVFVGDSVSLMLSYYTNDKRTIGDCLGTAKFLTAGSLGSGSALMDVSDDSVHPSYQGQKMKIEDAIAAIGAKKAFIMLGMNDIGLYGVDGSLENYKKLMDIIIEKNPGIEIYAESCTPKAVGHNGTVLNNENIVLYNQKLQVMCAENGWHYMDVYSVVVNEEGYLRDDFCSDPNDMGIHFTNAGCEAWVNYLTQNAGN